MHCNRWNTTCLLALLLLIGPLLHAEPEQAMEPYEAWFVLNMGGQKAGHMHITLKQVDDTITSSTEMKLAIKRGEAEIKIEQSSTFVESLDHEPIRAESSMSLGAMATDQKLVFKGEKWEITSTSAGRSSTSEIDAPDTPWLTPGALSKKMESAIERGDKEISVSTLDLSTGVRPIKMTLKRGEAADIEVFGKVVPATRWTMTMSAMPGIEIEQWTDAAGQPVRQKIALMPGMEMEMVLADKQLALADFDAPEMLAASLITPDKPIKNPRTLKRAVYEISGKDLRKNIGDTVPNDGYQRTEWLDDHTLRIEIDLDNPVENDEANPWIVRGPFAEATTTLNFNDPAVMELIKQTVDVDQLARSKGLRPPDPFINMVNQSVQDLRVAVRKHIDEKDLSVGFATASEVARTGQGDCTEHACLLAAMLRGAGIKARTVTGLVYADQFAGHEGVFGFHMWTQAGVRQGKTGDHWLDLDAAAPGQVDGFDATHIALSTSAMNDGETFNDMVALLPLMKDLKIKVVETEWAE